MAIAIIPGVLLLLTIQFFTSAQAIDSSAIAHCLTRCGDVEITYPFGVGANCSLPGFQVSCNNHTPYVLSEPMLRLMEILQEGEARVDSTPLAVTSCGDKFDEVDYMNVSLPKDSPFTISDRDNVFVVIGCGGLGSAGIFSEASCDSHCSASQKPVDGSCLGVGCCQAALPSLSKTVMIDVTDVGNASNPDEYSECRHGFLVQKGGYSFRKSDIDDFNRTANISMVLEWAVGKGKCAEAVGSPDYLCRNNSKCLESTRGSGYLCGCMDGHQGNPYVDGDQGCQDIDECNAANESYPCVPEAMCQNESPLFRCVCPHGSSGDGKRDGTKCTKRFPTIQVATGSISAFGVIIFCIFGLIWFLERRKLLKLQAEYFKRNGGILLEQQLSSHIGSANCFQIFSAEEIRRATKNYSSDRILGTGGNGTVYKGVLKDGTAVAIKKSESITEDQINQFINEVFILIQINHKNVVRLLGCCLETQVPVLVYEFISNGSLYQRIHENESMATRISWPTRRRIITQTAEALTYLHSCTSTPIIHRDVKSSNILLDETYTAKIADFGLSKLVPLDKSRLSTIPRGTFGYMDPQYFHTGKLTDKSDVYSFGVVLVELLTGRKPILPDSSLQCRGLAEVFLSSTNADNLVTVLEAGVLAEETLEVLQNIADIARRCLNDKGEERPAMNEVLQQLLALTVDSVQQPLETKEVH